MKKNLILCLVSLMLVTCDNTHSIRAKKLNEVNKPVNEYVKEIDEMYINSLTKFGVDFANQVFDEESKVFSPISIYNCFAMLYEGTTNNVRKELENVFYFSEIASLKHAIQDASKALSIETERTKLDVSSSFWVDDYYDNNISEDYLNLLSEYYYAEAYEGALESSRTKQDIANWINNKTNNMFEVDENSLWFNEYTMLVLLNSIYLKSNWLNEFNDYLNYEDDFLNINGDKNQVTFMRNTAQNHIYHGDKFDVASLSLYGGISFNMLLPHEGENSLEVLKNNVESVINRKTNTTSKLYNVTYKIPKFKTLSKFDLNNELSKMGLVTPFEASTDYENMIVIDEKLKDSKFKIDAVHEAGIEVNNDGIEAAAYTMIGMDEATSIGPGEELEKFEFNLNRPFMYALSYNDTPLFIGTYLN